MNLGPALPTLETRRLAIRAITEADLPALYEVFSDPEVTRYWSSPPLANREAARDLLRQMEAGFRERTLLQWGVTRQGEDRLLGTCTLASWSQQHRRAEVGFALARRHWGEGIMTEVLPAVLRFGFEGLELHRVEADVDPRNHASIRLLERQGFQREGYLRERYLMDGEAQDAILYGLLRSEWSPV